MPPLADGAALRSITPIPLAYSWALRSLDFASAGSSSSEDNLPVGELTLLVHCL